MHENQKEITNERQPATRMLFVQIWLPPFCIFGIHRRRSIDKLDFFLFHEKIFNFRFLHAWKSERNHERKTNQRREFYLIKSGRRYFAYLASIDKFPSCFIDQRFISINNLVVGLTKYPRYCTSRWFSGID